MNLTLKGLHLNLMNRNMDMLNIVERSCYNEKENFNYVLVCCFCITNTSSYVRMFANNYMVFGFIDKGNFFYLNYFCFNWSNSRCNIYQSYMLAEEAYMPAIDNGYYMFKDRHSESKDSRDDSELFDRNSYNFSIAIYDCDTDKMYYFEFDT